MTPHENKREAVEHLNSYLITCLSSMVLHFSFYCSKDTNKDVENLDLQTFCWQAVRVFKVICQNL
jgi:hypothetical protein